jgi:hypothetical protein
MRKWYKALRVANYCWLAIIVSIIILAAIPAVPGVVQVKLPGPGEWRTTEENGTISIEGEIGICNGGIFSLDGFSFMVMVIADSGYPLLTFESPKTQLAPGAWTIFPVRFSIMDSTIASADIQALFFSQATYISMVYFDADYILGFSIETAVVGKATFGPMVRGFDIHTNQTTVEEKDGVYWLNVPYDIESSLLLAGSSLYVNGAVSNATGVLGFFTTDAPLGGANSGSITMVLTPDEYYHLMSSPDTLTMSCLMDFGPFEWVRNITIDWHPPETLDGPVAAQRCADGAGSDAIKGSALC